MDGGREWQKKVWCPVQNSGAKVHVCLPLNGVGDEREGRANEAQERRAPFRLLECGILEKPRVLK